jgi:hypothetical protein
MLIDGKERSKGQWEAILAAGGWRLNRLVSTDGPLCQIIEAVKAQ